jgi:hypothetical protein
MAWRCIRLDYNAYRYINIATDVGRRRLASVALYRGIPFEITHREFLFRGFRGRSASVVVFKGALYRILTVFDGR